VHVKLLLSKNVGTDGRIIKLDFKEVGQRNMDFISLRQGINGVLFEDNTEPRFGDTPEIGANLGF
jgi:hypothetical protein